MNKTQQKAALSKHLGVIPMNGEKELAIMFKFMACDPGLESVPMLITGIKPGSFVTLRVESPRGFEVEQKQYCALDSIVMDFWLNEKNTITVEAA